MEGKRERERERGEVWICDRKWGTVRCVTMAEDGPHDRGERAMPQRDNTSVENSRVSSILYNSEASAALARPSPVSLSPNSVDSAEREGGECAELVESLSALESSGFDSSQKPLTALPSTVVDEQFVTSIGLVSKEDGLDALGSDEADADAGPELLLSKRLAFSLEDAANAGSQEAAEALAELAASSHHPESGTFSIASQLSSAAAAYWAQNQQIQEEHQKQQHEQEHRQQQQQEDRNRGGKEQSVPPQGQPISSRKSPALNAAPVARPSPRSEATRTLPSPQLQALVRRASELTRDSGSVANSVAKHHREFSDIEEILFENLSSEAIQSRSLEEVLADADSLEQVLLSHLHDVLANLNAVRGKKRLLRNRRVSANSKAFGNEKDKNRRNGPLGNDAFEWSSAQEQQNPKRIISISACLPSIEERKNPLFSLHMPAAGFPPNAMGLVEEATDLNFVWVGRYLCDDPDQYPPGRNWRRVMSDHKDTHTHAHPLHSSHLYTAHGSAGGDYGSSTVSTSSAILSGSIAVRIPEELIESFSNFCNNTLWRLLHYDYDSLGDEKEEVEWEAYKAVNMRFAEVVAEFYEEGDLIWVHDYHLLLLPAMLRKRLWKAKIGAFLYVPFPSQEIFRILPQRVEVLRGILGADLVGFYTYAYSKQFVASCFRLLGLEGTPKGIETDEPGNRTCELGIYPGGSNVNALRRLRQSPIVHARVDEFQRSFAGMQIIVGIDYMDDLFAGLLHKLLAFGEFLRENPSFLGNVVLVQVGLELDDVSNESHGPFLNSLGIAHSSVQHLSTLVNEHVGRINAKYGTLTYSPVHFVRSRPNTVELVSLMAAGHVCIMSCVRDGMRLLPHDWTVCQHGGNMGPLILSNFSGSSQSFALAVHVNPWDTTAVATAYLDCLKMSPEEKRMRDDAAYRFVSTHTAQLWGTNFLEDLASVQVNQRWTGPLPAMQVPSMRDAFASSQKYRMLMFRLEGALMSHQNVVQLAAPSSSVLQLLSTLLDDTRNLVFVLTWRDRRIASRWFRRLLLYPNFGLISEDGCFVRWPAASAVPDGQPEHVAEDMISTQIADEDTIERMLEDALRAEQRVPERNQQDWNEIGDGAQTMTRRGSDTLVGGANGSENASSIRSADVFAGDVENVENSRRLLGKWESFVQGIALQERVPITDLTIVEGSSPAQWGTHASMYSHVPSPQFTINTRSPHDSRPRSPNSLSGSEVTYADGGVDDALPAASARFAAASDALENAADLGTANRASVPVPLPMPVPVPVPERSRSRNVHGGGSSTDLSRANSASGPRSFLSASGMSVSDRSPFRRFLVDSEHAPDVLEELVVSDTLEWKESVISVMKHFSERTPGAFLEEGEAIVTWHYHDADADFGKWQSRDLHRHLEAFMLRSVISSDQVAKWIRVCPVGADRVSSVERVCQVMCHLCDYFLYVGCDGTDNHVFETIRRNNGELLQKASFVGEVETVFVGSRGLNSSARYCVDSPAAFLDALRVIVGIAPPNLPSGRS
ncbi:Alpha,alpha-trehalose-phosphate synthase, UDP-forming A [Porphyridium purpureum]|uniref:Alpha,alpha-trehalose-phosphate synthase, UDP-forming A n=1 Tax=Porphyridium purpureum TaxID=35688 RepID=A0A5J4Z0C8_PORPP|nr:Alpha,alpha-trehalose-phosphate synthase, UDP-forming A [Porphyridium purpureum]|eukprot:POR1454..scf209_3